MYINVLNCLIVLYERNTMDLSNNYIWGGGGISYNRQQQQYDLQVRRLRLISELIEDYQENMRRAMWLVSCELGVSNTSLFGNSHRIGRIPPLRTPRATDDDEPASTERRDPPFSFNRMTPQVRRRFIYTQLMDGGQTGLTNEQIENSTSLIQYDASMNEIRCPITWDAFEPGQNILQINNCRHIFGQTALMEWFQSHCICPVCRTNVVRNSQTPAAAETSPSTAQTQPSALNQLISGILSGVNNAATNENGYYESEFEISMEDLLRFYTQLVQTDTSTATQRQDQ